MNKSLYIQDSRLLYREHFNDEFSTEKNNISINGSPVFSNGYLTVSSTTSDYVLTSQNLSGRTSFTIRMKVVIDDLTNGCAISQGTSSTNRIHFGNYTDGKIYFVISNGATGSSVIYTLPSTGTYELVGVYDGGGATIFDKAKIYVNGDLVTVTSGGSAIPSSVGNIPVNIRIGQSFAGNYEDCDGMFDYVEIYNYAWNAQEVKQAYNKQRYKTTSLRDPSLVAAYDMIHWENTTLYDISGNGNNGVINSTLSSVDGFQFGGTNSHIDCGNDASLTLGTVSFTIAIRFLSKDVTSNQSLIYKGEGAQPNNKNWYTVAITGSDIFSGICDGNGNRVYIYDDVDLLTSNVWYNVIWVVDRDTNLSNLYLNNVNIVSDIDISSVGNITSTNNLRIGRQESGTLNYFNGYISDVRIFNEAKDQTWVNNYNISPARQKVKDFVSI